MAVIVSLRKFLKGNEISNHVFRETVQSEPGESWSWGRGGLVGVVVMPLEMQLAAVRKDAGRQREQRNTPDFYVFPPFDFLLVPTVG